MNRKNALPVIPVLLAVVLYAVCMVRAFSESFMVRLPETKLSRTIKDVQVQCTTDFSSTSEVLRVRLHAPSSLSTNINGVAIEFESRATIDFGVSREDAYSALRLSGVNRNAVTNAYDNLTFRQLSNLYYRVAFAKATAVVARVSTELK